MGNDMNTFIIWSWTDANKYMWMKSTLKKPCPRTQLCLKHVPGAIWAEGELGKSESTEARLAKPSKLGPDTGSTYGRPGLGGRQQRHGDLGEVIEDEEIQLPSVQQLRHWQKRPSGRGTLARPNPRCWPAPPGRAAQPRPGRLRNAAVYGAGAAAARRACPAPVPRPLQPTGLPAIPHTAAATSPPTCGRRIPPEARGAADAHRGARRGLTACAVPAAPAVRAGCGPQEPRAPECPQRGTAHGVAGVSAGTTPSATD